MKILAVGDPHAHPGYDNERFKWLGHYIALTRPNYVVSLGDTADLPSLCKHSKKLQLEGLRLKKELKVTEDALDLVEAEIQRYNAWATHHRRPLCKPRKYNLGGNHDWERMACLEAEHPELEGMFDDLEYIFHARDWETVPFKEMLRIAGWGFCHYIASGTMGRPAGGRDVAGAVLRQAKSNIVVGHDHRFRHATDTTVDERRVIHAFSGGCWVHPQYKEGWCKQTEPMWDRGLLLLDVENDGTYRGHQWQTMDVVREQYENRKW